MPSTRTIGGANVERTSRTIWLCLTPTARFKLNVPELAGILTNEPGIPGKSIIYTRLDFLFSNYMYLAPEMINLVTDEEVDTVRAHPSRRQARRARRHGANDAPNGPANRLWQPRSDVRRTMSAIIDFQHVVENGFPDVDADGRVRDTSAITLVTPNMLDVNPPSTRNSERTNATGRRVSFIDATPNGRRPTPIGNAPASGHTSPTSLAGEPTGSSKVAMAMDIDSTMSTMTSLTRATRPTGTIDAGGASPSE